MKLLADNLVNFVLKLQDKIEQHCKMRLYDSQDQYRMKNNYTHNTHTQSLTNLTCNS